MEQPEIHPPHHPHGGLPRWLEWVTSVSALVVSVTSIVIAVHSGNTMEKLVTANSMPYLTAGPSDTTPEGIKRFSVDLTNSGVGPAHEQSLKLRIDDRYVTSVPELVKAVVPSEDAAQAVAALRPYRNNIATRFIAANATQFVFRIDKTEANGRYWDVLDDATPRLHIEYCYCSVFKECWAVQDDKPRTSVKTCHRDDAREFMP